MTKFLIVRHGQSRANLEQVFAGHFNTPLSDLGRRQARITAEYVAAHYTVDRVYASDLDRAFDTAKASADRLGLSVIPEPGLREIFAGEWEGIPFEELQKNGGPPWQRWREDIGRAVCPGGESTADLQKRIVSSLECIARENGNSTVLIGTHATPVRVLMCHCMGKPIEYMQNISWVPNASVTTVLWENGVFTLERAGFADHLGDIRTALPANV